ncbi:Alpha/Beta hydrolase protein [Dichotomopilus funicola]|uniref:Alpha/Beta hydrolase protein n=1 Tax=Dichotomopilus funicola TaxID=1934379 RepID=A0AAN6ZJ00_9PEZI|nr:Alpha/Beta hydrolase protein [Dichotomopilus funicola]
MDQSKEVILKERPPMLDMLTYATYMYGLKAMLSPMLWLREWSEARNPPEGCPDVVKTYPCRPSLPIRVFLPASYARANKNTPPTDLPPLPTLFTIHGGGFCIGHQRDDDEWNRAFANSHTVLVISLNYRKAPAHPFPTALYDLEALYLAALDDPTLPIDRRPVPSPPSNKATGRAGKKRTRTALLGFSAGANLSLSLSLLPSVQTHPLGLPLAALSIYGHLDLTYPPSQKLPNRPYKPSPHLPLPRGTPRNHDVLLGLAEAFEWAYVPYGTDLGDPLVSPGASAPPASSSGKGKEERGGLPPFVGVVGAELDMLAHEGWRLACRLSRERNGKRVVPDRESGEVRWRVCGSAGLAAMASRRGELVGLGPGQEDERFAFEEEWGGEDGEERGGVKWLLVPDVMHGFDNVHIRSVVGGMETMRDAELKTKAYMKEIGRWLKEVVWRV